MPRHRLRIGCGDERMERRVGRREAVSRDCWTRVLRRSAGCRRTEEVRPERRPATKWKVVFEAMERWICQSTRYMYTSCEHACS